MSKLTIVFCLLLGTLIGGVIMELPPRDRADQERALRLVEDYRNGCRVLGGQPLTGSDFVLCFKQDALIIVPPRKE